MGEPVEQCGGHLGIADGAGDPSGRETRGRNETVRADTKN